MSGVPYTFANATTTIALSNLDANFNTPVTIGNTTVGLGNTVTTLGNVTLAGATVSGGSANGVVYLNTSNVAIANASVLAFDGSNLGVGVTPSAWGSGLKAVEVGGTGSYMAFNNTSANGYVYWNMWNDGTNNKTKQTGNIGAYGLSSGGAHVWFNGTGTTGTTSSLTQAMTLANNGYISWQSTDSAGNAWGFVGDGATAASALWTNWNTGVANFYIRMGGTTGAYNKIQFDNSGNAYKSSGSGSWSALSDQRIKTNIASVTDGLSRVLQLKPSTFDYKQPTAHNNKVHDKGFIAQDFQQVYPSSVLTEGWIPEEDQQYFAEGEKALAMGFNAEFYADLVSAIQELSAQVTALQETVTALQAKVGT